MGRERTASIRGARFTVALLACFACGKTEGEVLDSAAKAGDTASDFPAINAPDAWAALDDGSQVTVIDSAVESSTDLLASAIIDAASDSPCVLPLSELDYDCPATFDDVIANKATCVTYETIDVGECATDHLLMFRRDFFTHAEECFYDPQSRELVAAAFYNDVPICGDSRVETSSATRFCESACEDACGDRFIRLDRYMDCCRTWAFPIPGCPQDAGSGQ